MIDKERLDNLLNAYIDGELTPREHTEVKRLVLHDKNIASRLSDLEKCRQLILALPKEEAPENALENIGETIRNITPLPKLHDKQDNHKGSRQLLVRQVLATAAMLALAAILGAVIYTIVSPDQTPRQPAVVKSIEPTPVQPKIETIKPTEKSIEPITEDPKAKYSFAATMELNTKNRRAVTAFIQRVIADNDQVLMLPQLAAQRDGTYTITGSKQGLSIFLADLASAWNQLGEAWLYVENKEGKPKILVSNITPQQIDKIAAQQEGETVIAMAEDFAALNRLSAPLNKDELIITNEEIELMPAPKPVLTSAPKTNKTAPDSMVKEFQLTIVITGTE